MGSRLRPIHLDLLLTPLLLIMSCKRLCLNVFVFACTLLFSAAHYQKCMQGLHWHRKAVIWPVLSKMLDRKQAIKSFNIKSTQIERLPSDINCMCQSEGEWNGVFVPLPGILENTGHKTPPFCVNITPHIFLVMCGRKYNVCTNTFKHKHILFNTNTRFYTSRYSCSHAVDSLPGGR